ncbi:tripartite tricarboxylate transporter substrate binding protein [Vibrio sp. SS-MA-C1-2]|uniref:tripartite tricarboxylate transporter substrate binding protein n=1 Tax=Vibrio sp. SS-MA-C1-2 TaxID=2908646 RepID=UPI001F3BA3B4|nr:tripartite tricarboxylate transporter substrate binding protein [Vibrio sp. SS-MA-C1-2]UJF18479.1 tripartite tricarboxylate transporter substrate binding protein [Vibrio sp. SS-MA-C1-2]
MKKLNKLAILLVACASPVFANDWEPSKNIEWVNTSSAGGGTSIFTQSALEIIKNKGLVDENIIVNYKTDGGGAIGRRDVAMKRSKGHVLLTFNYGDLKPYIEVEGGQIENFTPLAVLASDSQVILTRSDSGYKNIDQLLSAMKTDERIMVGGSKSDDEAIYTDLKNKVGGNVEYIRSNSTAEALTLLLGGHVDIAIAKPAASLDLVTSGELVPLVSTGEVRFTEPFDTPTLKEKGYDISYNIWRGVVGPKNMPKEAAEYWSEVLVQVANSPEWKENYISKFMLQPVNMDMQQAYTFMYEQADEMKK